MVRRTRQGTQAVTTDDMRQPIQSRAQVTIDRVCEAALGILSEGGWDAFNTNVVAARAGVSGPTVYRYFPNKYVLAAELRRRLDGAESSAVLPAISRIGDAGAVEAPVQEWVEATARVRSAKPAALLLRSMSAAVPDLSRSQAEPDDVLAALTAALQRQQVGLTPDEAAERARAIRTSVDSLVDDAIRDGRPSAQQISLIVDLATTMIESASGVRAESLSGRTDR
jgi:AcrR family transcriptional regulator